ATVSFFFTDSSGDFGAGSTTIAPNGQIAMFLDQPPFNARPFTGTFTFASTVPLGVVALRSFINERSEYLFTTLPVTTLPAASLTGIVFPYFAAGGGWTTQLVLVNPTDTTLTGNLEFRDPAGRIILSLPGNSLAYSIPPRTSFKLQAPI